MLERIHAALRRIEEDHQVKILYACEVGSRAFGYPSMDSDYDVRFIFVHPPEWYLSIDEKRDSIEYHETPLDMKGYDIRQALQLFRLSNPVILEWLQSEIEYENQTVFSSKLFDLIQSVFSVQRTAHHYLHNAVSAFETLQRSETIPVKLYFSVLRPLLAGKWIVQFQNNPPLVFQILLNKLVKDADVYQHIAKLTTAKMQGNENWISNRLTSLDQYIEKEIRQLQEELRNMDAEHVLDPSDELNALFREIIKGQLLPIM